jgi:hypothetical protein
MATRMKKNEHIDPSLPMLPGRTTRTRHATYQHFIGKLMQLKHIEASAVRKAEKELAKLKTWQDQHLSQDAWLHYESRQRDACLLLFVANVLESPELRNKADKDTMRVLWVLAFWAFQMGYTVGRNAGYVDRDQPTNLLDGIPEAFRQAFEEGE